MKEIATTLFGYFSPAYEQNLIIAGYILTAFIYFMAWAVPTFGNGKKVLYWISSSKFTPTEFITCHAATMLSVEVMTGDGKYDGFWTTVSIYFLLTAAIYASNKERETMTAFLAVVFTRGVNMLSLKTLEYDVMQAEILKNLLMLLPMMITLIIIMESDAENGENSWQNKFIGNHSNLDFYQKLSAGFPVLVVTVYYLLWAFMEWIWPLRIHSD
jgi:hypothetical protein